MGERTRTDGNRRCERSDRRSGRLRPARWHPLVALVAGCALAVSGTGCGNLTAGGATGSASVAVSGDAPEEGGQVAPSPARLAALSADPAVDAPRVGPSGAGGPVQGQVTATLRVFLVDADGDPIPLLDGDARAEVDIQGQTEARLGARELDVGLYPRVRVVFTDIEADVRSGLEIGGNPLRGRVGVGDEDLDSLVVEIDREVEIMEGQEVELLVDLNSTAWLNAANPALKRVATRVFRNHVDVRVR